MDLSNRESAEHWYKKAQEVKDKDLRREALAAYRKYRDMSLRESRTQLRRQKPGYGVMSMFGWIMLIAIIAVGFILGLGYIFPIKTVLFVFTVVVAVAVVAFAITLRVYGHIGESSMLSMIRLGLDKLFPTSHTPMDATPEPPSLPDPTPEHRLPPPAPKVSFDRDDAKGA